MQYHLGKSEYSLRKLNQDRPVIMDTDKLINGHMLITGMSGTGKSHMLRRMVSAASTQGIQVDIFDVHHDLATENDSSVIFSEQTRYGYNPLELDTDLHAGGVRKRVNEIVALINENGKLGTRQESALRNLLEDTYSFGGIYPDDPKTWHKEQITESIRKGLVSERRYTELRRYYPSLYDAISLCERKLKILYLGADSKAITALERVNALAKRIQRTAEKLRADDTEQLASLKEKAIDAYSEYVVGINSGRELSDVLKYNSKDILQSVLERLQRLEYSGIFNPNPPPFNELGTRRYKIKHLSDDEKKLLVFTRCERIFREAKTKGIQDSLRHIIVIDEAQLFLDDKDRDTILNRISREARKFGLGLWLASQSPSSFSTDFLSNVGTTILYPIHTMFWDSSCRKLRIKESTLTQCRAREVAAVKLNLIGRAEGAFGNILIPQT